MSIAFPHPPKVKGIKWLLLGFERPLDDWMNVVPNHFTESSWQLENSFTAFRWLENQARINPDLLPQAILCHAAFLRRENFLFLKCIQNNVALKKIPVIAFGTKPDDLGCSSLEAIRKGIDDFYLYPVSWQVVRNRVQLLRVSKPQTLSYKPDLSFNALGTSGIKRIFDIAAASLILGIISPLLVVITALIKLESKGPVIYRSKRVGTGYQVFDFLKFRSMYLDADKRLEEMKHLNNYGKETGNPAFLKFQNDPRVTRLGRFLRKTSLDELPQLLNVIKGDMSIVGNRPLPLYEAEQLTKDEWARRFLAPAGITGLWQVAKGGKENISAEERIRLDIDYARDHTIQRDFGILIRTLPAMLQKGE